MNKVIFSFLLSQSFCGAASVSFAWESSTTPMCSNVFYVANNPITNIATAVWRFPVGTNLTAKATLSVGVWYVAATAMLNGIESAPALLTVIVPQPVTMLREVKVKRRVEMGHSRQRTR